MPTPPSLALIGAGYWGKNLARNFHALHDLAVLCDRSPEILASYGEAYSGVRKTDDFPSVLRDDTITRVAIAAPAALHYRLASQALEAGKDVYVEKPLCLDLEEARRLIQLAEERQRILMVGHLLQYHPCVIRLQEMLRAGELGELVYLVSNRLNLGKFRTEENALWSFAPHDLSVVLSLVGRLPESVACFGQAHLHAGIADSTLTLLDFGNVKAHIHVSWLHPFKEQKLTLVGSKAMAVFDDTKPWKEKLAVYREYLDSSGDGSLPLPRKAEPEYPSIPEEEPLLQECAHFLHCCQTRQRPKTDGEEGLRVLTVLQQATASLEA